MSDFYDKIRDYVKEKENDLHNYLNPKKDRAEIFKSIKGLTEQLKSFTDDQKEELASDPDGEFWDEVDNFINKDIVSSVTDSISKEEKDIIEKLKMELEIYNMYDVTFKNTFDKLDNLKVSDTIQNNKTEDKAKETPKTEETPKVEEKPKTEETPKPSKEEYVKGYTGVSIVDFLNQSGKPSDKEARRKLAVEQGIVNKPEEYTGTADQNTRLLNALRGGKVTSDDGVEVRKTELTKPYTTPKEGKGSTIKYGRMEYPAYVDMGGGKYRPAYQEELDNPNIQLYIPNPKKGASEYNKPNFVKVRREGSDIRPQSQFGGALGSASNFLGDIGRTLAGK
jgi:hypothetical protein